MIIGIDADGVLACFTSAFSRVGNKLFGLRLLSGHEAVPNYDWSTWYCTKAQEKEMWKEVYKTSCFWEHFPCIPSGSEFQELGELVQDNSVYVVTRRRDTGGVPAVNQTRNWLYSQMFWSPHVVAVTESKFKILLSLKVDYHIDDKFSYCLEAFYVGARSYMRKWPYNEKYWDEARKLGIKLVDSLGEYLEDIRKDKRHGRS